MRGAIYTRYSTSNQTKNSTETQVNACIEYCKNNNIDVEFIFSDEETTGTNINRNQYQNLLNVAKAKLIDCVVLYDVTRGSRDVVDWFTFRKEMKALNIVVYSVTENLGDIYNPDHFLTELIHIGIGEHTVLQSRQKSIEAKYTKANHAAFLGGFAPLGYDIIDQKYVINEREAEVVRRIFELYVQGCTYNQILEDIKNYGVLGKRGKPISITTLNGLLHNPRYIGRYIWMENITREMHKRIGKKNDKVVIIENAIPAIIDKETFFMAQERLKNRQIKSSHSAKREYLLSNKLFCGECGQIMRGSCVKSGKSGSITTSYVCKGKRELKNCNSQNISVFLIEEAVKEEVKKWVAKFNINKLNNLIQNTADIKIDVSEYEKELKEIATKKQNLINSIANGFYCPEMNEQIEIFKQRENYLNEKILYSKSKFQIDTESINKKIKELIQDLDKNINLLVKEFVKCIIVHKDKSLDIYLGINSSEEGRTCNWLPR